jgi:hypothetical protein
VDRQVEHEVELGERDAKVRTKVRLTNDAPSDLVPYVAGITTPNRSSLRVELSFPPPRHLRLADRGRGDRPRGRALRRGPLPGFTYVDSRRRRLGRGELRYSLPVEGGSYRLTALPQALARDAELTVQCRARRRTL